MPEEVPVDYRYLFHFNNQRIAPVGNKGRTALVVERDCIDCDRTYDVIVCQVRADFKRGRKMIGRCKPCRNDGIITKDGYVWMLRPRHPRAYSGKYVPQHILVMEEKLGRYLDSKNESVHHINGDRSDNRIENLQLRTRYHGKGQARVCGDCGSQNILTKELA